MLSKYVEGYNMKLQEMVAKYYTFRQKLFSFFEYDPYAEIGKTIPRLNFSMFISL